jgi:hypothetical protein
VVGASRGGDMIVIVDLNGTIIGNQRLGLGECLEALALIHEHRIVERVRLWTSSDDIPPIVRELVDEVRSKPGRPVDSLEEWENCLLIDDEDLLLSMCKRCGARAIHANQLDQIVGMLDDIADGEA